MKTIEFYNGIEIRYNANEKGNKKYSTIEEVPVMGNLETMHLSLEDAKVYIDSI